MKISSLFKWFKQPEKVKAHSRIIRTKVEPYICPHSGETFLPGEKAYIANPNDKGRDSKPMREFGNNLVQVTPCHVTGHQLAHFKTLESFNEWNFWFQCPQSGNKFRRGEVAYCCYVENRGRSNNEPFVTGMIGTMNPEFAYFRNMEEFNKWNNHERNA